MSEAEEAWIRFRVAHPHLYSDELKLSRWWPQLTSTKTSVR